MIQFKWWLCSSTRT